MTYANTVASIINTVRLCGGGNLPVWKARRHLRRQQREVGRIALKHQCAPGRPLGDWLTWTREERAMRQANRLYTS